MIARPGPARFGLRLAMALDAIAPSGWRLAEPARLAVPGPVWGERPSRADATAASTQGGAVRPRAVARRGPPAGRLGDAIARASGADARTVARRAARVATRLLEGASASTSASASASASAAAEAAGVVSIDAAIRGAAGRLATDGLGAAATALALGAAGAAMARATGLAPRDNQYRCAALLLAQRLVELDTGEGKSVAVALAAGVAALAGAPVHVLTANPYLAGRDAQAFEGFYRLLGLRVAAVDEGAPEAVRREAWGADVAYANARVAGFDALRDGIAEERGGEPLLVRGRCVAIVDEADSILVDEARTPLVIAEAVPDPHERARAWRALDLARRLAPGRHLRLEAGTHRAHLTEAGRDALRAAVQAEGDGAPWHGERHREEFVEQALSALHLLRRDVDYLVADREVLIVDASTGRAAPGRQWSRSLHALVALKEGVPVPPSTRVRASQTYPRLLARYHHLCGTSGTLREARVELRRDYGLCVVRVERTHRSRLATGPARLFADRDRQFDAAMARAAALASDGRSVLVATDSVADSAELARRFADRGIAVEVLDARHDGDEAARVAAAGEPGRITVSTQMAGRGTDIRLAPASAAAGGLHVLSLQHNRSARIDRQVAGRAARQTDPGSAEHWLRLHESPLEPDRLPGPLSVLVHGVRVLARRGRPAAPLPAWTVRALWRACQLWWRLEDAQTRSESLRHDSRWSRRLHFASMPGRH